MLRRILKLLGFVKASQSKCSCGSQRITKETEVIVCGSFVTLTNSPQCKNCTEANLNKWATKCEKCGEPICIGQPVAAGTPGRYIHLDYCCNGEQFLGFWGEGVLVSHE